MKSVLVTGASGFVGTHLVEHLLKMKRYEVFGTHYGGERNFLETLLPKKNIFSVNLLNKEETFEVVSKVKPDFIYHLAALSSPAKSFEDPQGTIVNNTGVQINLFEAVIRKKISPKILVIGSAEEYGLVKGKTKVDENHELSPLNSYAVSKIAQDYLGLQYYLAHGIEVVRVRPFNHTGDRQSPIFVLPAFAKQIVEIERGEKEELIVKGNLDVVRDFTDVKDIVVAYELAMTKGIAGEVYNLGSGRPVMIEELLDMLIKQSSQRIMVKKDTKKLPPAQVKYLVCDYSKFTKDTGWEPTIKLEDTVKRVLNYWREELSKSGKN
jgi:GDP-4-dehydro-6-deoxy-D-mannose reductase